MHTQFSNSIHVTCVQGECKESYKYDGLFCFVSETSECLDKRLTPTFYNPYKEESNKFYSLLACYPPQITGGEATCPGDSEYNSTVCGDACLPPGQRAQYNNHLYCCSNNDTDSSRHLVTMEQSCHGKCGSGNDGWKRRRSMCGKCILCIHILQYPSTVTLTVNILGTDCIYSSIESSRGEVFCCHGNTTDKNKKCDGCDYKELPCGNSSQCIDVLKWCDGVRDCQVSFA